MSDHADRVKAALAGFAVQKKRLSWREARVLALKASRDTEEALRQDREKEASLSYGNPKDSE